MKIVEDYYDSTSEYEDVRLKQDAYHKLEFDITMHHLKKHLPKKGHILDLGCGTGPYSLELAKMGYDVTLFDLSKNLLKIAEKNFKKKRLMKKVKEIVHGSATDLSMFKPNSFDAVICMGPFYHLIETKLINKVISEIKRVAKKNAMIEISAINYYGVLVQILRKHPHEIHDKSHSLIFSKGIHTPSKKDMASGRSTFPAAKFFKQSELKQLLEKKGLKTITMFACQGLSTHQREATNELSKNKKRWNNWMKLLIQNSTNPEIMNYTEHFGWIGKNS